MTMWTPDLEDRPGSKYLAIADAIERDVAAKRLPPGAQLPPQRDLARALGVTVGTVGRGYAEARRRGLLSGEVGRGTFVRAAPDRTFAFEAHGDHRELVNLAHNEPHFGEAATVVRDALADWSVGHEPATLGYQDHVGSARHRAAGAAWISAQRLPTEADQVVITSGAQHGMLIALSTAAEPGDRVLSESLAYPGIKAIARFLRFDLEGVPVDGDGMIPEAFEEACRKRPPRALYCTPTIQNPTATILPEARRRAIAEIAQEHGVTIVEDDTYGFLASDAPPPISSFAETAVYLTSLSKCLSPGLRIGYLRAPGAVTRYASAMMTTTIMTSPLCAELASLLLERGCGDRVAELRRQEARQRQALAREILGEHTIADGVDPASAHLWLTLPVPWRAQEFAHQAHGRGVAVAPAETFAVGRVPAPHCVRVSLGAVVDTQRLTHGLEVLADLLATAPAPSFSGM